MNGNTDNQMRLRPALRTRWWTRLASASTRPVSLAVVDQVIVGGTNFLTMVLVGRSAGVEQLGFYSLALSIVFLSIAAQESLITGPYTVFVARLTPGAAQRYRGSATLQWAMLSASVSLVLIATSIVFWVMGRGPMLISLPLALAAAVPAWLLRELARRFAFAQIHLPAALALSAVSSLLQLSLLAALAFSGQLWGAQALWATSISSGLAAAGWFFVNWQALEFHRPALWAACSRNWIFGKWLLATQVVLVARYFSVAWILAATLGASAAGVLAACEGITKLANPLFMAVANVLTPRAAHALAAGGVRELHRVILQALAALAVLVAAICGLLLVAGGWLLQTIFDQPSDAYQGVLMLVALSVFSARMMVVPERGLMVLRRTDRGFVAELSALVAVLVAAACLVPLWGLVGAALSLGVGAIVTVALFLGSYWILVREDVREKKQSLLAVSPPPSQEPAPRLCAGASK